MKRTGSLVVAVCWTMLSIAQQEAKETESYTQLIPGTNLSFKMNPVPAGTFLMGSAESAKDHKADEGPQRSIQLSGFWIGAHEVTHDEFLAFFNDESFARNSEVDAVTRPTTQYIDLSWGMGKQGGFPTNSMSQLTALMYCRWLFQKTGIFYRLPTEAEWEYACRAGTTTVYPFGNDAGELEQYAWFAANSANKYHKVGEKKSNAWGLFDMLGNVSEWTLDQYDEKYFSTIKGDTIDPLIPPTSRYPKALRGGGFNDKADMLLCSCRFKSDPSWNKRDPQVPKSKWWLTDAAAVGFRIVRPLKQPTAEEVDSFFKTYLSR